MMLQIVQVDPRQIETCLSVKVDMPAIAFVGVDDGKIIGSGGLAWGAGRCWIWLSMISTNPAYALPIARKVRVLISKAKQLGETIIYTPRDAEYQTSEKLLKTLGFKMHGIEDGIEVWACQA
jgi:hypothetical protein